MNNKYQAEITDILKSIEVIHNEADKTMSDRKEDHNLADNSSFYFADYHEIEKDIIGEDLRPNEQKNDQLMINLIKKRRSVRDYNNNPIKLSELYNILRYTFGFRTWVDGIYGYKHFPVSYIPSSGGLAAVTNYILIRQVEGLKNGIYRYNRVKDCIEMISEGNPYYKLPEVIYGLDFAVSSSFSIFLCADLNKLAWKYGERSYRFAHMDTGIAAQNLHLIALEQKIGSCMIAGYKDKETKEFLNLKKSEIPMLLMSFGKYNEK